MSTQSIKEKTKELLASCWNSIKTFFGWIKISCIYLWGKLFPKKEEQTEVKPVSKRGRRKSSK